MYLSLSWPFVAFSYFAGASVNLSLSPNISFKCFVHLQFHASFVQMCHFAYFSSVEACLPGNTVLKLYLTVYTQMCQKCHFQ